MRHTVDRMISKPSDYKRCERCGCWNWYENLECINCGSNKFRKVTDRDVEGLKKAFEGYILEELELEV